MNRIWSRDVDLGHFTAGGSCLRCEDGGLEMVLLHVLAVSSDRAVMHSVHRVHKTSLNRGRVTYD